MKEALKEKENEIVKIAKPILPGFFRNVNLWRLIISLGLAAIVWGYVTITQYPEKTLPPLEIPLTEPIPPPSDLAIVPTETTGGVKVIISGPTDQVAAVIPSQIKPYLDLSELKQPGPHDVPVRLKPGVLPSEVTAKIEPKTVPVVLEKVVSKAVPVEIIREGEVNPDYFLDPDIPPPSPAQVTVSGRESLVSNVTKAQVTVNVTGRVGPLSTSAQVQLLDGRGQRLNEPNLTISPTNVNVTIVISYKLSTRTVPIRVITKGDPAAGYIAGAAQTTPVLVTVTSGNAELLSKLEYVETEPVDITSASRELMRVVQLRAPSNITVVGNDKVTVKIGIVPFQTSKNISVTLERLNEASNLRYIYSSTTINLTISGPFQAFQPDLPLDKIRATIDLQGRAVGSFELPVVVSLPPDLVVTNSPTVSVTITRPLPTATPIPPTPIPPTATPAPTRTPVPTNSPGTTVTPGNTPLSTPTVTTTSALASPPPTTAATPEPKVNPTPRPTTGVIYTERLKLPEGLLLEQFLALLDTILNDN